MTSGGFWSFSGRIGDVEEARFHMRGGNMSSAETAYRSKSHAKIIFFAVFALATVFVTYMKNQGFFDPSSPTAQHYRPAFGFLVIHGFFAGLALLLGVFQLSNRLRARYLGVHRALGYVYVACVFVAAPVAIPLAAKINTPSLLAASCVQAFGWTVTTAIALYCVRTGNIVQHRRWMIRSYCLATVFTVGRLIIPIPPIMAMGDTGIEIVVWSTIALMMFLPNIFLDWQVIAARPKVKQTMATALMPEYSRAA
jgi:uncharacterized membrane protein